MKKAIYLMYIFLLLFPLFTYGQQASEGKIKVGKDQKAGFIATSKYDHLLVQDVITGKLNEAGIKKHTKKKKFYTYSGILWPEISPYKIDLYYKVQKKGHRSKIYFIVSKGYDNYISSGSDATITANITNFLGRIDATIAHNEEIKSKEQEVKATDDKLKKAEDEKKKKEQELDDLKKNKN